MSAQNIDSDLLRRKRDLHAEIGRSRRRVADRLGATRENARQLLSWRSCVARHPLWSLAAALGFGMTLSAGLRPGRVARRLGASVAHHALDALKQRLWAELQQAWTRSAPDR